jgi:hypothetical protein
MAQQPSVSAATQTNYRDAVAREVFGTAASYSTLTSTQQTDFDKLGDEAFFEVTSWAKWYAYIDPAATDLNGEFNEIFRLVWIQKSIRRFKSPPDSHAFFAAAVKPRLDRIADTYTADWMSGSLLATDNFTVEAIRKSAIAILVRQRTPVFPPMHELDRVIREEYVKLWNERQWAFRREVHKLTIATTGDVTIADADVAFDGLASKHIFITDANNARHPVKWMDATNVARLAARYDGTTGRPRYYYIQRATNPPQIVWLPAPDQAYSAYATVLVAAPTFAGTLSTIALGKLPPEFRANLRDMVVAKLAHQWGREDVDAARLMRFAISARDSLAASWASQGNVGSEAMPHHSSRFATDLASWNGSGVVGQLG